MVFIPHVAVQAAAARQHRPSHGRRSGGPAGAVLALVFAITLAALAAGVLGGAHADDVVGCVFLILGSAAAGFAIGRGIGREG
ncbi:MAG: hypothetical protein H6Q10_1764 [Acidobacteria bacterium]|nr:hypothetical protein [Acidobacteriota bacterium]